MPGGVQIGTRTTIVRLADGSLFFHSPGPANDENSRAIAELGEVRHLVAPNLFHHFYVKEALAEYDAASFDAPPGFDEKVPDAPYETLTGKAPGAWAGEIDQVAIDGAPRMNEIVFCHRPSRTLLLTDLCFNMRHSDSLITRVFMSIMGGYGHFGPSRLARSFMKDKRAVRQSVEQVLELDFDRVIVTHGQVLESGGHDALEEAFKNIG
jgi:hypothetical protein